MDLGGYHTVQVVNSVEIYEVIYVVTCEEICEGFDADFYETSCPFYCGSRDDSPDGCSAEMMMMVLCLCFAPSPCYLAQNGNDASFSSVSKFVKIHLIMLEYYCRSFT